MRLLPSLAAGLMLTASAAMASTAQAEDKVCFYEDYEYEGAEWCYGTGDVSWIGSERNDKISSIKLYGNAYVTIYEHGNFEGKKTVVMGNTYRMDDLNDGISSFKVGTRRSNNFACLFEHPGYRGTPFCVEEGQYSNNLDHFSLGQNNASSLMVVGKTNVYVYEDANFSTNRSWAILSRSTSNLEHRPGNWVEDNIGSIRVEARTPSAAEKALDINETLSTQMPLRQATVLGTHNSFNSTSYFNRQFIPGPNHRRTLIEQLQLGARFFELDIREGDHQTKVCHATDCGRHDTTLRRMLGEVDSWLKGADENDVVMFFLQDDFDGDAAGYEQLKKDIDWLGDLVYTEGSCQAVPDDLTLAKVRESGKRVLFYKSGGSTGCHIATNVMLGSGFETNIAVADINVHDNHVNPNRFLRSQECYNNFCRDTVSANEARTGIENGVNAFGLDMLEESDIDHQSGRFSKQLWVIGSEDTSNAYADGRVMSFWEYGNRFMRLDWNTLHPYACRLANGNWAFTQANGDIQNGAAACNNEFPGSTFDVPLSAAEAKALRSSLEAGAVVHVNFGYDDSNRWKAGKWGALGAR